MTARAALPQYGKAVIVGVGLMGGSLGMELRGRGIASSVIGVDPSRDTLERALTVGAVDSIDSDAAHAVRDAHLVFVAAPITAIPGILLEISPHLRADALVSDLGSTKRYIARVGATSIGPRFVAGHPMAGTEIGGIQSARLGLFEGAAWAIVRADSFDLETDADTNRLATIVRALGALPIAMDSSSHDRLTALVSHLPHLISFAFARAVASDPEAPMALRLAGGSFRDMMRVSGSDQGLWRDIFRDNRNALMAASKVFRQEMDDLLEETA